MDIVLLFNGLGNQMSQYALYLAKCQTDPHTQWLYFPEQYTNQHNGYELERIFGIKMQNTPKGRLGKIYNWYLYSQVCESWRRQCVRKILSAMKVQFIREKKHTVDSNVLAKHDGYTYFYGGWHNPEYFQYVADEIREIFRFDDDKIDDRNKLIVKEISSCNSVSIHVRRSDFVKQSTLFGNIATPEYYKKAMEYIKNRVEHPVFYIFSDDIGWCRENIEEENMYFVDWNMGEDSWKDMMLMSKCKHNINANSTFSWWGAWLNENPEKIVIVPDKFMNVEGSEQIYPKDWIKIQRDE